jgi:hypothetical protein
MPSLLLTGSNIKLYINNKNYKEVQSINFTVDYGETEIYGIDTPYPQEVATTRVSVRGTVQGLRIKLSGGLQGANIRPLFTDIAAAPYISLRISDRYSGEDIIFIPNCKVTRESHSIPSKGIYRITFDFVGQIPLFALDRA